MTPAMEELGFEVAGALLDVSGHGSPVLRARTAVLTGQQARAGLTFAVGFHRERTRGADVFSRSDVLDALEREAEHGFVALREAVRKLSEPEAKEALATLVWSWREHGKKALAAPLN